MKRFNETLNRSSNPVRWSPLARQDLRAAPVHPYAVFYRIVDGNVEIVRVLHEHRDFATIFANKNDQP